MPYTNTWGTAGSYPAQKGSTRRSMSSYSPEVKSSLETIHKYINGQRLVPELNTFDGNPVDVVRVAEESFCSVGSGIPGKTLDFNSMASSSPNPLPSGVDKNNSFRSLSPARRQVSHDMHSMSLQPADAYQVHSVHIPQPQSRPLSPVHQQPPMQPHHYQQSQQPQTMPVQQLQAVPTSPTVFEDRALVPAPSNAHYPPVHSHTLRYTTLTLTDVVNFLRWHYSIDKKEEEGQLHMGEGISTLSEEDIVQLTACFTEELLQEKRSGNSSFTTVPTQPQQPPQQYQVQAPSPQPPQPTPQPQQMQPQPQYQVPQQPVSAPVQQPSPVQRPQPTPVQHPSQPTPVQHPSSQPQPQLYPVSQVSQVSLPSVSQAPEEYATPIAQTDRVPKPSQPEKHSPNTDVQLQPVQYPTRRQLPKMQPEAPVSVPSATSAQMVSEPTRKPMSVATESDLGTHPTGQTRTQPLHATEDTSVSDTEPTPVQQPASLPSKTRATPPSVVTPRSSSSQRRSGSIPLTPKLAGKSPSNPSQLTPKSAAPLPHPQRGASPSPPHRSATPSKTPLPHPPGVPQYAPPLPSQVQQIPRTMPPTAQQETEEIARLLPKLGNLQVIKFHSTSRGRDARWLTIDGDTFLVSRRLPPRVDSGSTKCASLRSLVAVERGARDRSWNSHRAGGNTLKGLTSDEKLSAENCFTVKFRSNSYNFYSGDTMSGKLQLWLTFLDLVAQHNSKMQH